LISQVLLEQFRVALLDFLFQHDLWPTATMAQLASVSKFPALFPSYIAKQEEMLIFKGRQFGSSYDIKTIEGRALFAVEPVPSLGRRMRVLDNSGKNIFCTRKETFHVGGSRYFIETPARPETLKLVTLEFKMLAIGDKFTTSFNKEAVEHQGELVFNRDYFSTEGTITDGAEGPVIALVERKIINLRKEYQVIVSQGIDMALISGLIICLGEQEKSHSNAPALGGGRWG
jgi:uncharacterized protein YxjI